MKASMIFYRDWYEMARSLSDEERLMIYDAVMEYAFDGKLPEDKFIKTATALMLSAIDRDSDKYEKKCEKLRQNINKRWERHRQVATTGNICIQKNTNESNSIQIGYDNDNDDDNDVIYDNNNIGLSNDNPPVESGSLSSSALDMKSLMDFFNTTMKKYGALIPTIRTISGPRKTHTLARIREHGAGAFRLMIETAAHSDFLNGRNFKGWTANYDWLIKPENFVKVIEGNYNNRQHGSRTQFDSGAGQEGTGGSGYDSTL